MTPKIMRRTSQAAPVCDPKKRDRRFSRAGECLTRMPTKTPRETMTATAKKSSRNPMTGPAPDDRDVEVAVEQAAVGLDDGEEEDGEAPEGEGVGHAGDGPLEQLLLPAHLDQLGLDPLRDVLCP